MRRKARLSLAVASAIVWAMTVVSVWAQVQPPPRDYDGLFGGSRTQPGDSLHQLTLDLTGLAGWDDDVGAAATGGLPSGSQINEGSFIGEGQSQLAYRYGRQQRYLRLTGGGTGRTYSALDYTWQVDAGGSAEFYSRMGRDATFRASHSSSYQNFLVVGNFGALTPLFESDIVPGSGPSFGISRHRAWSNDSSVSVSQQWSQRHETNVRGGTRYVHSLDADFQDLLTYEGLAQHSIAVSRSTSVGGGYAYSHSDYNRLDDTSRPVETQTADVSVQYERRLSPTRGLSLQAGVGGTRIDTISERTDAPIDQWSASGSAAAATDIGRSWSVRGSYVRGWSMQEAFTEPLFSDSIGLSVGGYLNRRTDLVFSAGYSNGRVGFSDDEDYTSTAGAVQARFALSRNSALFASYVYYRYDFQNPASLPTGTPQLFNRQVVRVGVSLWLPLVGVFQGGGTQR
jgi:hypothetical protein